MKEKFIDHNFRPPALKMIQQANEILDEYAEQGLVLSLRQLYYQFVSKDWLANNIKNYSKLGDVISDARMAGLIDWEMLEDRGRFERKDPAWSSPQGILDAVSTQYKEDLWIGQPHRVQVWVEKDALTGVIDAVCKEYRVPYIACRGYTSQSMAYNAGKEFSRMIRRGIKPIVLHLGDHDPSGIDMTRDNEERLALFAGDSVTVKRLALNFNQVQQYNPPPNPAKDSDSRSPAYKEKYGEESWELDALNPRVIASLIRDEVKSLLDTDAWSQTLKKEESNRQVLAAMSERWADVKEFLSLTPDGDDRDEEDE
jgi:hypothetical protein